MVRLGVRSDELMRVGGAAALAVRLRPGRLWSAPRGVPPSSAGPPAGAGPPLHSDATVLGPGRSPVDCPEASLRRRPRLSCRRRAASADDRAAGRRAAGERRSAPSRSSVAESSCQARTTRWQPFRCPCRAAAERRPGAVSRPIAAPPSSAAPNRPIRSLSPRAERQRPVTADRPDGRRAEYGSAAGRHRLRVTAVHRSAVSRDPGAEFRCHRRMPARPRPPGWRPTQRAHRARPARGCHCLRTGFGAGAAP